MPLLDVNIVFNPSRDFLRCITLAHVLAGAVLMQSHLPLPVIMAGIFLLLCSHHKTKRIRSPQPNYACLKRNARFWMLEDSLSNQERYDTVHIQFDGGFFFLLRLTSETDKKTLVLFDDQITQDQHRRLKVLSRIT